MRSELAFKTIALLLSFLRDRKKNRKKIPENRKLRENMCSLFLLSICHSPKTCRSHHALNPGAQSKAGEMFMVLSKLH